MKIFGFKHKYPQSFLDNLAKTLGFEWTKVEAKPIEKEKVLVKPMSPPSNMLCYFDVDYKN